MGRKKKVEFLMKTDWMFDKPIDQEHKEYVLLSYFQKMGEKLDKLELYPGFIELSLHLANAQTLIKDKKILYTDKKFKTVDDELLVMDLKIKDLPPMTSDEHAEFIKILSYSTPKLHEYFDIAKSVWETVFDNVIVKVKKNIDNITLKTGYFYYENNITNVLYVWEYEKKPAAKGSPENKLIINLIYSDEKKDLTITKIIDMFSNVDSEKQKILPIVEMTVNGEFPLEETLLPLFKRKLISYIVQKKGIEDYKKTKEQLK
jgi:hypothetical protein